MRKSQQRASRKRSAKINRLQAKNRRLRSWWWTVVVAPLKRMGCNSRANRYQRARILMSGRKESPVYRRTHPDWNMMHPETGLLAGLTGMAMAASLAMAFPGLAPSSTTATSLMARPTRRDLLALAAMDRMEG